MKAGYVLLAVCGICLCAGLLLFSRSHAPEGIPAASAEERELYLFTQGWKGRQESVQEITVPDCGDAVFAEYAALQEAQGLPLSRFAGETALRYVYRLEPSGLYAELLTADGVLIGAMCTDPVSHKLLTITGKPFA